MIKDLTKIREYLNNYVEVEMPYEFIKNSPIQYITCEYDEEGNHPVMERVPYKLVPQHGNIIEKIA